MAVRLTVIMVHSPPATASAQRIAESAVGEIIGRPGIDLTLVGPPNQIEPSSTDRLTLDSITGDAAVMDWRTPDDLIAALGEVGFMGARARHADDPGVVATPGQRRIYAFDLNQVTDAKDLCQALNKLLADRQVKTVSLAGLTPPKAPPQPGITAVPPTKLAPAKNSVETTTSEPSSAPKGVVASPKPASIDLDDLVDQLDELDP